MNLNYYLPRPVPEELRGLAVLALDLRWSWNHAADALWETVDPEMWRATGNPSFGRRELRPVVTFAAVSERGSVCYRLCFIRYRR
jgi:hypothetical protein